VTTRQKKSSSIHWRKKRFQTDVQLSRPWVSAPCLPHPSLCEAHWSLKTFSLSLSLGMYLSHRSPDTSLLLSFLLWLLISPAPMSYSYTSSVQYSVLVMSTISKRKDKRFDIEAYYRNESKMFWFGLLSIGTKAKIFDLVPKKFLFQADRFHFGLKILGRSKAIWFGLEIVMIEAKRFDLVGLLSERKQNVLIWSSYYRNESKTIWYAPKIISAKTTSRIGDMKTSHRYFHCPFQQPAEFIIIFWSLIFGPSKVYLSTSRL
jgi:hypothetical protein